MTLPALFARSHSGRLVHVDQVANGLACACTCDGCGEAVVAVNGGRIREHHFRHESGRDPCLANLETQLHLYAKGVIAEHGGLTVPVHPAVASRLRLTDAGQQSHHLAGEIDQERQLEDVKPDLLLKGPGDLQIAVEIAVTHFCDELKVAKLQRLDLPTLEIDLSGFAHANFDLGKLNEALLRGLERKSWLWPPAIDAAQETLEMPGDARSERSYQLLGGEVAIRERSKDGSRVFRVLNGPPEMVNAITQLMTEHGGLQTGRASLLTWIVPFRMKERALEGLWDLGKIPYFTLKGQTFWILGGRVHISPPPSYFLPRRRSRQPEYVISISHFSGPAAASALKSLLAELARVYGGIYVAGSDVVCLFPSLGVHVPRQLAAEWKAMAANQRAAAALTAPAPSEGLAAPVLGGLAAALQPSDQQR